MHSDMGVGEVPPEDEKRKFAHDASAPVFQGGANNIFGNAFFERQADGTFRERSDELNLENYWPWGVSVGDVNADGWPDVFITASMNFPYRYGINSLLLNNLGQTFLDGQFVLGIEPRRDGRTRKPWFTIDCGPQGADRDDPKACAGRTDRYVVTGTLGSRASAIFDLDRDGDLDIVTNEFNSEPQVFVSDLGQRRKVRWLEIRLVGQASNRDAIGARVRLKVGGRTLTQVMDGSSGYLSHGVMPLYFGLGDAAKADSIEVTWPSGAIQSVRGPIAAGRSITVTETRAAAR
jgi:hypothetical protein